jgi:hypothetical protein
MSFTGVPELKDSYRQLGRRKFLAIIIATVAWIGGGAWFMVMASWPSQCDHEGRKIAGFIKKLYCSPDLLSGGAVEFGLFAWLWSMPALLIGVLIWALARKARNANLSLYSDKAE